MKIRGKLVLTFVGALLLAVVLLCIIIAGYLKYNAVQEEKRIRQEEQAQISQNLKNYVDIAFETIKTNYQNSQDWNYLKSHYGPRLQNIVDMAQSIVKDNIKLVHSGKISLADAQKQAAAQISKMRYDNGKGYLWINDTSTPYSRMIMHPTVSKLNGKLLDSKKFNCAMGVNKNLFSAMVEVCNKNGEGFVDYLWPKPTKDGLSKEQPKLSYVKKIPEWNWIIGTGIYVDDALEDAIKKAKTDIGKMRYDKGIGYFWINDTTLPYPKMIMHPTVPKLNGTILDAPKFNCALGQKKNLFAAMVEVCNKNDEGFVDYLWPKPTKDGLSKEQPKLSYVKKFAPLNWIIGTGCYIDSIDETIKTKMAEVNKQINILIMIIIIVIAITCGISTVLFYLFANKILILPLRNATEVADAIAIGDISKTVTSKSEDEIGELSQSLNTMVTQLKEKSLLAEAIAKGNLSQNVKVSSSKDVLGLALKDMVKTLLSLILQIRDTADQIGEHSEEVQDASQLLSKGASEQASSLEEITSTMTEIGSQAKLNSEHADEANNLSRAAADSVNKGNDIMDKMLLAMKDISQSSKDISKIIKSIDEIAFQTNILALNAAVEAARAGVHGKGFAIVAEEVRTLAQRSTNAASETSDLIEKAIKNVEYGLGMADTTAESLSEISGNIAKTTTLIAEIAAASKQQASGVNQVNVGLEQIDKVTQSDVAHAENTASASLQLAKQSEDLRSELAKFEIDTEQACIITATHKATPDQIIHKVNQASQLLSREGKAALQKIGDKNGEFIFGGTYIWVHDINGTMQMHPIKSDMNGKNLLDIKDSTGKKIFAEMNSIVRSQQEGWISYMWPKPGEKEPSEKISFVKGVNTADGHFVLGCGVYDIEASEIKRLLG